MYSDLADAYGLLKIGGSDYHGKGGHNESELGSVNLPVLAVHDFLKVARPIWYNAIRNNLEGYAEEPSDTNLSRILRFSRTPVCKLSSSLNSSADIIDCCLSMWLTNEERNTAEIEAIRLKLCHISSNQEESNLLMESI